MQSSGHWLVSWSPATIAPPLRAGDKLTVTTTWPARAAIEGAGGMPLTGQAQQVTIGVEGSLVKDATSLTSALVAAGATAQQAGTAITAAKAHPTFFEPVFTVPQARYEQLKPTLYPIPGTVFSRPRRAQAITPGLTAGAGRHARADHRAGASVARRRRTARRASSARAGWRRPTSASWPARPSVTVAVVTAKGAHVATLATLPGHAGHRRADHDRPERAAGGGGGAVR